MKHLFHHGIALAFSTLGILGLSSGCNSAASSLKITNGIETNDYPAVVMLRNKAGLCTGTFIARNMILTAAHCVLKPSLPIRYGDYKSEDVKIQSEYPQPKDGKALNVSPFDLAIVRFDADIAPAVMAVNSTPARVGDSFTIVGYGINDMTAGKYSGSAVKRFGNNVIRAIADGFIKFQGTRYKTSNFEDVSVSGPGDSGGPLIVNRQLVGITSGGAPDARADVDFAISVYVNLQSPTSQNFLAKALQYASGGPAASQQSEKISTIDSAPAVDAAKTQNAICFPVATDGSGAEATTVNAEDNCIGTL